MFFVFFVTVIVAIGQIEFVLSEQMNKCHFYGSKFSHSQFYEFLT